MYKVEKYKFMSESTNDFIKGNVYFLRTSKRGDCEFLTTEKDGHELLISNGKMSSASKHNINYLNENFEKVGESYYKNYTKFTNNNRR